MMLGTPSALARSAPQPKFAMLIIINDDAAYTSWIFRHRGGFVIDSKRKPTKGHLTLHRATCPIIKPHKRARLTTGAHLKACSLDAAELAAWAVEQTQGAPTACSQCQPDREPVPGDQHARHALTRVGKEILSHVLDLAILYLDGEERHYGPSVKAVAVYLDKTPKQILPALERLVEESYLECDPPSGNGSAAEKSIVYPTARALRTIPAFDAMSGKALTAELESLKPSV
jgi:hypothetical protein